MLRASHGSVRRALSTCSRLLVLLVLLLSALITDAQAESKELRAQLAEGVDAVLLLDASGSMRITDPHRLRDEGARLFAQFLRKGDRLAVVQFAGEARVLRPLSEYDASQADQLGKTIARVGNDGVYTDLTIGVREAASLLAAQRRDGSKQVIVLLSDGKMDPDPKAASASARTQELLESIIPELKEREVRIHTVSLSDQADRDLLRRIALESNGVNFAAETADSIHQAFAELFLAVKKPQVVALTSRGFKIDAAVDEATFYMSRDGEVPLALVAPDGEVYSSSRGNVKWFTGQKFDVATVSNPAVGDWKIEGLPSGDTFAAVLTNLKLLSDWPSVVSENSPVLLQAQLYDGERPIELPMTGAVQYGVQIVPTDRVSEPVVQEFLVDDGTHGDRVAGDGVFSRRIMLDRKGEYRLRLVARAPTFERAQQQPFRVKPRAVSLTIESPEGQSDPAAEQSGEAEQGSEGAKPAAPATFVVELSDELTRSTKIEVRLIATHLSRRQYVIPLRQTGTGRYQASSELLTAPGEYELQVKVEADLGRGRKVQEESQRLRFTKADLGAPLKVIEVVEKEEEEEGESFPFLSIFLLTVVNGAVGVVLTKKLLQILTAAQSEMPQFTPPARAFEALEKLRGLVARGAVPLSDPIFTDASLEFTLRDGASSSTAAAPQDAGEAPADDAAAQPEPEAAAPEASEAGEERAETEQPAEESSEEEAQS